MSGELPLNCDRDGWAREFVKIVLYAQRYRWLRDRLAVEDVERLDSEVPNGANISEEESLKTDAAIDAAMR